MAEDAFVTDFEHIMADDITDDVRFIMYDSASGKTASAGEVNKYMMKNIHVDTTLTEEGSAADAKAVGGALAKKADTKGRYEDIVAGGAEQLMADGYETDTDPYLFRPTGGSADVGNREYLDKIVGGTVAWNQLFNTAGITGTFNGVTITATESTVTFSGTSTAIIYRQIYNTKSYTNHVYYLTMSGKKDTNNTIWLYNDSKGVMLYNNGSVVQKANGDSSFYLRISDAVTYNNETITARIHDLTAMFGTTIADYIYSLEQSQAGAGVAWFRNYFQKDYYPYDKGTLRSVEGVSAHEMVGFNQWDEEWELGDLNTSNGQNYPATNRIRSKNYIRVLPSTTYYFKSPYNSIVCFYDEDKNFVNIGNATLTANATFTTQSNVHYMRISPSASYGTTYNHDICINLSDPSLNGTYKPYTKHTYPLDSTLTLRGIPKLDASNNLYYDGDVYESDGTVTRKYGIVDLGTLNWTYYSDYQMFYAAISGKKAGTGNLLCSKYRTTDAIFTVSNDKSVGGNGSNGTTYIRDTAYNTDAAAFKTAMSGVYLVYELATPTTETAEGYEQYQICDPSGTEEFVTDSIVPVGHETRYPHDLKKKIETAPDSPSTDGTYLMKRSGGKNSYMALPSTPSASGAYVLTVTVSGGSASYSWAAKE